MENVRLYSPVLNKQLTTVITGQESGAAIHTSCESVKLTIEMFCVLLYVSGLYCHNAHHLFVMAAESNVLYPRGVLMLEMLAILLIFQLIGELIVVGLNLPAPGPVIGMALLFIGLVIFGRVPEELGDLTRGLLDQLSLLFVPAGVGVMTHLSLLSQQWIPLTSSLIISTLLTLAVTGWLMQRLTRNQKHPDEKPEQDQEGSA